MCRTCTADSSDQLQPLFSDPNLAKQLEEYAGIVVKPDDGLPDKICMDCTKSLQSVHAFLTGCRRSDAHLRSVVRRTMSSGIGFPSNSMDQSAVSSSLSKIEKQVPRTRKQNICARNQQIKKLDSQVKNVLAEPEITYTDFKVVHDLTDVESNSTSENGNKMLIPVKYGKPTEGNKSSGVSVQKDENYLLVVSKCVLGFDEGDAETDTESNEYIITDVGDNGTEEDYDNGYTEPDSYAVVEAAPMESTSQFSNQVVDIRSEPEEKPVLKGEEPTSTGTSLTMVDLAAACEPSNFPRHSCAICGNSFPNQTQLKSHLRTHRNEKNYECELCSKRFNAACNLTTHMRTHTGEKPFECSHCSRRFADRSTHRKHERMHTNERPYACNMCTKTFSLSTTLKAHFLSHSKEKPHKCVTCNKGFRLPHQLKAHERTHVHRYEVGIMLYNQDEGDYSSS
ncbi:zinc finger and SCAN domain-containing protein 2 [Drosophila navojoa]|uniref:zinc finger and SCAN domain-containing protein 2 n=1 Tax=Drosophila navojoa TaxID=7232 RepID=UPI0011BE7004|nr:zinc finger and SCAN domain-containing protein 2 [Drosophila navojoa]